MGTEKTRKRVIAKILTTISEHEGIDLDKLTAIVSLEYGYTRNKVKEYIDTILDAEKVYISENKLFLRIDETNSEMSTYEGGSTES